MGLFLIEFSICQIFAMIFHCCRLKHGFAICSSFLLRVGPRECHNRILRIKLYRIDQFSSKLAPGELDLYAFSIFQRDLRFTQFFRPPAPSRLWAFLQKIRKRFKKFTQFRVSFLIPRFSYRNVRGVLVSHTCVGKFINIISF